MLTILAVVAGSQCSPAKTPSSYATGKLRCHPPSFPPKALALSTLDWTASACVVIALLPPIPGLPLLQLIGIILLAQIIGVISTVPGGLGVFELVVIKLLPASVPDSQILSSLLAFRALYYFFPFLLAVFLLAWVEWRAKFSRAKHELPLNRLFPIWKSVAPNILAISVMVCGVVLLVSGNTPALPDRMAWLSRLVPLSVVEGSHFLGSIVGLLLLVLGWGLQRRVRAAWTLSVTLLALGIVASLLKGWDYEEGLVLAAVLAMLYPARDRFTRQASLLAVPHNASWWLVMFLALAGSVWVLFIAYSHVEYRNDLWWKYSYADSVSRGLRTLVGVVVTLLALGFVRFLSPSLRQQEFESEKPNEDILRILKDTPDCASAFVWLGDKRFFLNKEKTAFLMYGIRGRSLVVLGDPIGEEKAWDDLLWEFRDKCHTLGARPVFYEITENHAHRYIDMGLHLYKIGEDARIPLPTFSMEGKARADLRQAISRSTRDGYHVDFLTPDEAVASMPTLRKISDAWLTEKNATEKSFSLGRFDEDYLSHFPTAVVRRGDEIIAFANLLLNENNKEEMSVDLMRYDPETELRCCMSFLFAEIILFGKKEGYQWFSLGVAPLSGLDNRELAPVWHRLATAIFNHGEHFYNFQGLRAFKEKFQPEWRGVYLATTSPWELPSALIDTSALISGDIKGLFFNKKEQTKTPK